MNPVPLFLIAVTLPLLLGGCGKKKSVEEKNIFEDNITGKAFTLKSPYSDPIEKLIFGEDGKFSINEDGIIVSEGSFTIEDQRVKVTRDFSGWTKVDLYQFYSLNPKAGDEVSMIEGRSREISTNRADHDVLDPDTSRKLSIVKIEPAENVIVNDAATLSFKRRMLSNRAMQKLNGLRIAIYSTQPKLLHNWQDRIQREMFAPPSLFLSEQHPKTKELKKLGNKVTKPWPSHFALNKNLVGKKIPTNSKIVFLFESDLGWNGLGALENVIDYVELYKLEKVSICFSNGDYEFVDKSKLKSLKWELERKGVLRQETERRDDGFTYLKGSDTPYTGKIFVNYENGQKMGEVNFKDGKVDGVVFRWHENGQKKGEAYYKDGEKIAVKYWNNKGEPVESKVKDFTKAKPKQKEINYDDDLYSQDYETFYLKGSDILYTGKAFSFYKNGQKSREINFKDGKEDGNTITWYENGKLSVASNYKDGKKDGVTVLWYENGQKQGEANFKNGKKVGLFVMWHENGKKSYEGNFKDGKEEGLEVFWYESGQKRAEENNKDGKGEGLAMYWHENGLKMGEENYKDDELVKSSARYWNSSGEPVDSLDEAKAK